MIHIDNNILRLLRSLQDDIDNNYGEITEKTKEILSEYSHVMKITEVEKEEAIRQMSVLVMEITDKFNQAKKLANLCQIQFTLDFIADYNGPLTYDGKNGNWTSSSMNC